MTRTHLALPVLAALALALPSPAHALGDDALVFVAPSSITYTYDGLAAQLRAAGAPSVDVRADWPDGDLAARYRLIVLTPNEGPSDPAIGDALASFADAGGGIVIMAEHDRGDEAGNALAARLGLAARFAPADTGGGCSSDGAAIAHPLTEEAPTVDFAWSRQVEGGTILYGASVPVVTLERTVVLAGDSDLFADAVALGGCPVGPSTERFYRNLYTSLAQEIPIGGADAGPSGSDGGLSAGGLGAPCASSADCASSLCATFDGRAMCTEICSGACAMGFTCESAGDVSVCAPPAGGGGCSVGARGGSWLAIALAIGLALARRARRSV